MHIQQLHSQIANLVVGKNLPPPAAQQTQASYCPLFAEIGDLIVAMEAADSAMNFYEASPPNHRRESSQLGLRVRTRSLVNTQGD
jgi:hypothetical protein